MQTQSVNHAGFLYRRPSAIELKTPIRNLFIIGDGAGITRGLIQASASGIIAARAIVGRG